MANWLTLFAHALFHSLVGFLSFSPLISLLHRLFAVFCWLPSLRRSTRVLSSPRLIAQRAIVIATRSSLWLGSGKRDPLSSSIGSSTLLLSHLRLHVYLFPNLSSLVLALSLYPRHSLPHSPPFTPILIPGSTVHLHLRIVLYKYGIWCAHPGVKIGEWT